MLGSAVYTTLRESYSTYCRETLVSLHSATLRITFLPLATLQGRVLALKRRQKQGRGAKRREQQGRGAKRRQKQGRGVKRRLATVWPPNFGMRACVWAVLYWPATEYAGGALDGRAPGEGE